MCSFLTLLYNITLPVYQTSSSSTTNLWLIFLPASAVASVLVVVCAVFTLCSLNSLMISSTSLTSSVNGCLPLLVNTTTLKGQCVGIVYPHEAV